MKVFVMANTLFVPKPGPQNAFHRVTSAGGNSTARVIWHCVVKSDPLHLQTRERPTREDFYSATGDASSSRPGGNPIGDGSVALVKLIDVTQKRTPGKSSGGGIDNGEHRVLAARPVSAASTPGSSRLLVDDGWRWIPLRDVGILK